MGEKLKCKHDTREEAKVYDEFAFGIYHLSDSSSQDEELVGHFPIELSFLLCKIFYSQRLCHRIFTDRIVVSQGQTCGSRALYRFFKQPHDGIHSSSRTRAESGKTEAHEVGGHAAKDLKKNIQTSST